MAIMTTTGSSWCKSMSMSMGGRVEASSDAGRLCLGPRAVRREVSGVSGQRVILVYVSYSYLVFPFFLSVSFSIFSSFFPSYFIT